jgi:hypothetical protein
MRPLAAALCLCLAAPAIAETPMTAAEFEAYVLGRTLTYSNNGAAYGAEQYLPNRKVIWTFLDGDCVEGRWYEREDLICFTYAFEIEPQCWSFWVENGGLAARFENDPAQTALYEISQGDGALRCDGPGVGV